MMKKYYSADTTSSAYNTWHGWCVRVTEILTALVALTVLLHFLVWMWDLTYQVGFYNTHWRNEITRACKQVPGCMDVTFERNMWNPTPKRKNYLLFGAHTTIVLVVSPKSENAAIAAVQSVRGADSDWHLLLAVNRTLGGKQ